MAESGEVSLGSGTLGTRSGSATALHYRPVMTEGEANCSIGGKEEKNGSKGFKAILGDICTSPLLLYLAYTFAMMLQMPLLHQYTYMRFSEEENFPYHYEVEDSTCGKEQLNQTLKSLQSKVQAKSAHFQTALIAFNTVPSLVACMYMGSWSDNVGRKPVFILNTVLTFLQSIIVLFTMVLDLPVSVLYIGYFVSGIGGHFFGLELTSIAYIADTTAEEQRALWMGIMETFFCIATTVSSLTSGHFISTFGFTIPYVLIVVCQAVCCLYAIFAIRESVKSPAKRTNGCFTLACMKYPLQVWDTLSKSRQGRWKIALLLPAIFIFFMPSAGGVSLRALYLMNSPFCMSPIRVGYFIGTRLFLMGVGIALGIKFLALVMQPYMIALTGILSFMALYAVLAIAQDPETIYIGCFAGAFAGMSVPVFRSILSKTVGPNEQGALFSAVTSLEMIAVSFGNLLFNEAYAVINKLGKPRAVFILANSLFLFPFVLTLIYRTKSKAEEKESCGRVVDDSFLSSYEEIKVDYCSIAESHLESRV